MEPTIFNIPSGKRLHNELERSTMLFMSKSTISMTIFNSKLLVYRRVHIWYMALSNNGVSPESTVWSSYFPISTGIFWGICSKKSRKISQLVSHFLPISCCLIFCRVYIPFFTQCLKNPKHLKTLLMVWLIWYHLEYGFRYKSNKIENSMLTMAHILCLKKIIQLQQAWRAPSAAAVRSHLSQGVWGWAMIRKWKRN